MSVASRAVFISPTHTFEVVVLSLAKARAEARDLLALLRREPPVDPAEERKKRREQARAAERAIRFSNLLDAFAETEGRAERGAEKQPPMNSS